MKKTLQSLEHFIQSINNLENQNNGALPLGMRSQREIIKKQIKLTHAIIKKDPNINIINISFGEIYHIIETYRGFFDIKEITDKCKKHLKENNIKINTFLDILSYYLYDINWDIASKKHGIIRSNSIALDHYIKIPQGSIVEIYSMYEQNSGDFGIGYNIDLPLFIKHYHFNNNKPIEVNSLKELDKLKNSISFLNIETLSSEDINNYIKLSKKNNNTLFLYHTKKIKIFSTEIKEFKTDIELKLSPVYRYYPNYKKEQFRQTYLKINQIINKNEYDFAEIPYSKEGINYYKEYLDLSIIKTNQIKVEINNKIIYYFYNGKSNLKLKQKISNKFYLSKGDLISDNIYDVLNLIKKDNIIKKQLKKEISILKEKQNELKEERKDKPQKLKRN